MQGMKISELDFLRLLPAFMQDDEAALAFSKAMNQLVGEPGKRLHTLSTWGNTDELNEAECDELAWELDIDWYDSTGMSLENKRETIKFAQQIKRKRGTKWAVERLISAYFGDGYVMEWFELGDIDWATMENITPYTFTVFTTNPDITAEYDKFLDAVNAAKNERSRVAKLFHLYKPDLGVEYSLGTSLHRYDFVKCGTKQRTATVGLSIKGEVQTAPEASQFLYSFEKTGTRRCGTHTKTATLGAANVTNIATAPAATFAAYAFTKCGTRRCGQ